MGFVDGSKPCPSPTIATNSEENPNPEYSLWDRQDKLILSAIAGSISPNLIPFIASARTSREAWDILAKTYAKPSRGRITQLKENLRLLTKGTQPITDYLQQVKIIVDELAMLNHPIDTDDLILKILSGLDEDYKDICSAMHVRENPITFEELHEKLINFEAHLRYEAKKKSNLPNMPASANPTQKYSQNSYQKQPSNRSSHQSSYNKNRPPFPTNSPSPQSNSSPRLYLGKCQLCSQQGHSAKRCPTFRYLPWTNCFQPNTPTTPHHSPQAHFTTPNIYQTSPPAPSETEWLLDSGASHHVTSDLRNLSLHSKHPFTENIHIGNGTGLPITHTGSTTLPSSSSAFILKDVLCVPSMKKI